MGVKLIIILLIGILLSNGVYASEFTITSVTKQSSGTPYRGDSVSYKGIIQADPNNFCNLIDCSVSVQPGSYAGVVSDSGTGSATELSAGITQEFPFSITGEGSGPLSTNLIVSCKTKWNCVGGGNPSHSYPIILSFFYPGDGTCTTSKEKCEDYGTFLKDDACSCPHPPKECRPNGDRNDLDEKGCQSYCGNKIVEKQYENCNNCPDDVGKCDGTSCILGSECEGKYCVHNICNALPYRVGDNYCDNNVGETCKNSGSDCACGTNQRCSNTGVCETFCGNGVCEASEQGICKADCQWCGDGTCESSESCSSCDVDCGVCKKPTKDEELQRNTQTKDVQTKQTTQTSSQQIGNSNPIKKEQKTVSLFGKDYNLTTIILAVIALIVFLTAVSFLIYKKVKSNKKDGKKHHIEKKEHDEPKVIRCEKCNKKIDGDSKFCLHCGHKIE
ncbi:MAG: hypothetical protein AABX32_06410 [Nanoarchaeota archaeon]